MNARIARKYARRGWLSYFDATGREGRLMDLYWRAIRLRDRRRHPEGVMTSGMAPRPVALLRREARAGNPAAVVALAYLGL